MVDSQQIYLLLFYGEDIEILVQPIIFHSFQKMNLSINQTFNQIIKHLFYTNYNIIQHYKQTNYQYFTYQMSQYRAKIKTCLQTITKSIKQIPEDKQAIIASRVNKVLQKYTSQQTEESLMKFNKELEFNLNFIKLSYPNIDFTVEEPGAKTQQKKPQQPHKDGVKQQEKLSQQFELQNSEALKKEMKDISGVREEVDFSNWSEGNVDPENIKRHKQLITRQHFGGDFWQGKERPKMESAKHLFNIMGKMEPPTVTSKDLEKKEKVFASGDPAKAFEKVKR